LCRALGTIRFVQIALIMSSKLRLMKVEFFSLVSDANYAVHAAHQPNNCLLL
jgi:hypothetical protein